MMKNKTFLLSAILLAADSASGAAANFFQPFRLGAAAISPDGKRLAYLMTDTSSNQTLVIAQIDDAAQSVSARLPSLRDLEQSQIPGMSAGMAAWSAVSRNMPFLVVQASREFPQVSWPDSYHVLLSAAGENAFSVGLDGHLAKLGDPYSIGAQKMDLQDDDTKTFLAATYGGEYSVNIQAHPFRLIPTVDGPIVGEAQGTIVPLPVPKTLPQAAFDASSGGVRSPMGASGGSDPGISFVNTSDAAIRASQPLPTELFSFDPATGVSSHLADMDLRGVLIYDAAGRPRILQKFAPDGEQTFELSDDFRKSGGVPLNDFRVTPSSYLRHRTVPLGFGADPSVLYCASNEGRERFGIYAYDLKRLSRGKAIAEDPDCDFFVPGDERQLPGLIFDRGRNLVGVRSRTGPGRILWLDEGLTHMQRILEARLRTRRIEILDWDDSRNRIFFAASTQGDPGRFLVYDRRLDRMYDFGRREPQLSPRDLAPTREFSFSTPEGRTLTGRLTQPTSPRASPPALAVLCRDGPWEGSAPDFDRETQALSAMGLIVLEVHYRGSAGFGVSFRDSLRVAPDRIPLEDIRAGISWLSGQIVFDRQRIAVVGKGFGGYLACRAIQLYPETFNCSVCIEAPLDLVRWTDSTEASRRSSPLRRRTGGHASASLPGFQALPKEDMITLMTLDLQQGLPLDFLAAVHASFLPSDKQVLDALSPALHPESISRPLFIVQPLDPFGRLPLATQALLDGLVRRQAPVACFSPPAPLPGSLDFDESAFARIGQFLNLTLYSPGVKIGDLKVLGGDL